MEENSNPPKYSSTLDIFARMTSSGAKSITEDAGIYTFAIAVGIRIS